jgi:hypothetical protein
MTAVDFSEQLALPQIADSAIPIDGRQSVGEEF